jgi:16S rRNA (guanine527-N7)-methyltransferase
MHLSDAASSALRFHLEDGLARLGVDLPADAGDRLLRYVELLAKWNGVYNLTAIREPERMVTHHIVDSLAVLPSLDAIVAKRSAAVRVLDVGSGAGLPGLPIAIARPAWQVVLREPIQKKVAFITQAVAELGVRNATPSLGRVEDMSRGGGYAIVISRAFTDLASFAACAAAQLDDDGRLCAMKGVHPDEELRELPAEIVVEQALTLDVPGVDAARHLIVMKRRTPQEAASP